MSYIVVMLRCPSTAKIPDLDFCTRRGHFGSMVHTARTCCAVFRTHTTTTLLCAVQQHHTTTTTTTTTSVNVGLQQKHNSALHSATRSTTLDTRNVRTQLQHSGRPCEPLAAL